jgi:hypothetical protein
MPRATITNQRIDLTSDNGAVLWSIVQGEQFEAMLTFKYLTDITSITFKGVLLEAANVFPLTEDDEFIKPTTLQVDGEKDTLVIRKPLITDWDEGSEYAVSEVVRYSDGSLFICTEIPPVGTLPTDTKYYDPYTNNKVFLQFSSTLSLGWAVQPTPEYPTYGFIEVALSDDNPVFSQTLKSIRGMVEFVFSPTLQVV